MAADTLAGQAELYELDILDTPPEQVFDDLTTIAAQVAGVPIAMVTLFDADRQWIKAKVGVDLCFVSRQAALCEHVVRTGQI